MANLDKKIVTALLLPFFLSSCLILHEGKVSRHEELKVSNPEKPPTPTYLELGVTIDNEGNVTKLSKKNSAPQRESLQDILEESRSLQITDDISKAKLNISASIYETAHHNALWYLFTAFSLTLIPYHGSNEFRLEATVKDSTKEKSYVIEDGTESYVQLFLLPVPLFHWPRTVFNVIDNMYRDLAIQIHRDFDLEI